MGQARSREELVADVESLRSRLAELEHDRSSDKAAILDAVIEHVVVQDAEHRVIWANSSAARSVGLSNEELVGRRCYKVWVASEEQCVNCPVARALATGKAQEGDIATSGGRYWHVRGYPLRVDSGRVTGAVEIRLDFTEQRRALEALRESELHFRTLAEKSPNMIFINCRGRVVYVNEKSTKVMGYSRVEFTAPDFDFLTLIAPESRDLARHAFEQHQQGLELPPYEYTLQTRSGEIIQCINATRLISFGGEMAILGIITDVSDLKRAQNALRESEERYRKLVETGPDAITVTDLEGNLVMTNVQAAKLHGYGSVDELLSSGKDAFEFVAPEDRQRAYENARRTLEHGAVRNVEYQLLRTDGVRVPVELSASLLVDAEGNPEAFIGVVRDITQRQKAEEARRKLEAQVQQAQKMESLGLLAGGIAHDFNNLLTGILGNASLALMSMPESMPGRQYVAQVEHTAARAAELTKQLLAYSGQGQFTVELLDLSAVVQEIGALLRVTVPKKVRLEYDLEPELPAVEADATQLRQIVMNLVINGAEAIGVDPGVVSLATGVVRADRAYLANSYTDDELPEGRYVHLDVSDTGCGMDRETVAKIFDPFFTTKFTGRGLGLAAVLGIVRGHGGAIRVYSEVGHGTTVRVLLPASRLQSGAVETVSTRIPSFRMGGTILVVDDEETVLTTAQAMMDAMGFETLTATDGRRALEVFRRHADDIKAVLLDVTMPEMSGADTLRELRKIRPEVRVILSSGYSEKQAVGRLAGREAPVFIQKPYRLSDLAKKLRDLLGGEGAA